MKSKAHSKKCQETGVLEELEAEEGNELPTPSSPSPSDTRVQHLGFQSTFRSIISLGLLTLGDEGRYYYYFSNVAGEAEAQRGKGICLGP